MTVQNGSLSLTAGTGLTLNGSGSDSLSVTFEHGDRREPGDRQPVTATLHRPVPGDGDGRPRAQRRRLRQSGLSLGTPNDLATVTVTPSGQFNASLGGFANLDLMSDIQQALQAISRFLSGPDLGIVLDETASGQREPQRDPRHVGLFNTAATALGQSGGLGNLQPLVQNSRPPCDRPSRVCQVTSQHPADRIAQDLTDAYDQSVRPASADRRI